MIALERSTLCIGPHTQRPVGVSCAGGPCLRLMEGCAAVSVEERRERVLLVEAALEVRRVCVEVQQRAQEVQVEIDILRGEGGGQAQRVSGDL